MGVYEVFDFVPLFVVDVIGQGVVSSLSLQLGRHAPTV